MTEKSFNFTNTRLLKLENTTGKDEEYKDTGQKGLVLRVTKANNKIFRLKAWNKTRRQTVQMVLGRYPELKINDARSIVVDRLRDMAHGIDVIDRLNATREEQTFENIFRLWIEEHAKENKKTWDEDERRYDLYIKEHLGPFQLSQITPDIIRRWRIKLTKMKKQRGNGNISKSTVNRAFAIVSTVFNKCATHMPNPCREIGKYKEKPRDTFLNKSELHRFFSALNSLQTPDYLKDYLLLSLYTGARRTNILGMKWKDVDLDLKLWIIPAEESKNSEPMVVPLIDQTLKVLQKRKKKASSIFVFPGLGKTGHLVEPKKAWKALLKRADLNPKYRLHDLRRTMGSWQAITGSSTKVIGASLGHKSEAATAVYARLTIDPVRESMERAAAAMDSAKEQASKVIHIKKAH